MSSSRPDRIVPYRLTAKVQELVKSIINLLQWMGKWGKVKESAIELVQGLRSKINSPAVIT